MKEQTSFTILSETMIWKNLKSKGAFSKIATYLNENIMVQRDSLFSTSLTVIIISNNRSLLICP